jgi:ABC-2 type transport system permease protein
MDYFIKAARFESTKTLLSRVLWIVFGIVIVIQPLLAFVEAIQLAGIGIDATPITHPELAVALPPVDYFGFDLVPFGQVAMVVWGSIMGASEFRNRELRTTLLCLNKRAGAFLAKLVVTLIYSVIVSIFSIVVTIAVTHVGLDFSNLVIVWHWSNKP